MKFPANCNAYFVEDFFLICLNCYCSLVTFREAFFVNKVHRKPESCGAKRVTVNGVNSNS